MAQTSIASQLFKSVESMVDPNAPVEKQLAQMRQQLAALSELPRLIQQKLETVNRQMNQISYKTSMKREVHQEQKYVAVQKHSGGNMAQFGKNQTPKHTVEITELPDERRKGHDIQIRITKPSLTEEELEVLRKEELKKVLEEKVNAGSKTQLKYNQVSKPSEHINVSRATSPRRKPEPMFGPGPIERPLYLPGGRRWKMSEYDEDQISETLTAQAEVIKGNAIGVNFKKFEKPPPPLDHLQRSEVYKVVHNMDETPLKKVELLRPAVAASEIRERLRSVSPNADMKF